MLGHPMQDAHKETVLRTNYIDEYGFINIHQFDGI